MAAANGNANDKQEFYQLIKEFKDSVKSACDSQYHIGDSALYVADSIQALDEQRRIFISRVPAVISQAKNILNNITSFRELFLKEKNIGNVLSLYRVKCAEHFSVEGHKWAADILRAHLQPFIKLD